MIISAAVVREHLDYSAETGVFRWLKTNCCRLKNKNAVAGSVGKNGYVHISLFKKQYRAHRLAWLWVKGVWPDGDIDHKDGERANNRMNNLRVATRSQQMSNRSMFRGKQVPYKGVRVDRRTGKYDARITVDGKTYSLGAFLTPEEAAAAYVAAAERLHKEYARTN